MDPRFNHIMQVKNPLTRKNNCILNPWMELLMTWKSASWNLSWAGQIGVKLKDRTACNRMPRSIA